MARKLLGRRAAARYVSLGEPAFQAAVKAGEIPYRKDVVTGRVRYSTAALDEYLRRFGFENVKREAS